MPTETGIIALNPVPPPSTNTELTKELELGATMACGCDCRGAGALVLAMFPKEHPKIVYLPLGMNVFLDKPVTPSIRNEGSCPQTMAICWPEELICGAVLACDATEFLELDGNEPVPAGKGAVAATGEPPWKLMVWAEPGFAFEVVWMEVGTGAGAAAAPRASIPGCGAPESIPV